MLLTGPTLLSWPWRLQNMKVDGLVLGNRMSREESQAKGMVIYILKHKLSPEGKVEGLTASECMRQTHLSHCALESALSNAQEVSGE